MQAMRRSSIAIGCVLAYLDCREFSEAESALKGLLRIFPKEKVSDLLAAFAAVGYRPKVLQVVR